MSRQSFFAHPFHGTLRSGRTHRLPAVDVTLLFADVVDSTELTHRLGERGAYSVIRRFCSLVRETSERLGGESLELRGDGALMAFPSSYAALECATAIQRACTREGEISIRMGVHAGRALRLERGYFGQALILAARLADHARPAEVLVSGQLLQGLGAAAAAFEVDSPRAMQLKGFPDPVQVFRLAWQAKESLAAESADYATIAQPAVASGW